jgi:hypothetical protein
MNSRQKKMTHISTTNIDDIDDLDLSGDLDSISFIGKKTGTIINNYFDKTNDITDKTTSNLTDNLMISSYFNDEKKIEQNKINYFNPQYLPYELVVSLIIYLFFSNITYINLIINFDNCISLYILLLEHFTDNDYQSYRINLFDRYIYYGVCVILYNCVSLLLNYNFIIIIKSIFFLLIVPNITNFIYDTITYQTIRNKVFLKIQLLIKENIVKNLTKIINLVILNILDSKVELNYQDLIPFYDSFKPEDIGKFFGTVIGAGIFNHLDKGGLKFPLMFYKNLYMKDKKYKVSDDKKYLIQIINNKDWKKFMDIYSLNRVIRLLLSNDSDDPILEKYIQEIFTCTSNIFNKVFIVLTFYNFLKQLSISNNLISLSSVLLYSIFITKSSKPIRYIILLLLFIFITTKLEINQFLLFVFPIISSLIETNFFTNTIKFFINNFMELLLLLVCKMNIRTFIMTSLIPIIYYFNYQNQFILYSSLFNIFLQIRYFYNQSYNDNISNDKLSYDNLTITNIEQLDKNIIVFIKRIFYVYDNNTPTIKYLYDTSNYLLINQLYFIIINFNPYYFFMPIIFNLLFTK